MAFFIPGESKTRPGTYFRYENWGQPATAGANDGVCAAVFQSNWGPVNRAVALESMADITRHFGEGGTTEIIREQFRGGARRVMAVRVNDGSGPGSYAIMPAASGLTMRMLHPGNRRFSVTIRPVLGNDDMTELLLHEGTSTQVLERIRFAPNTAQALYDAYKEQGSNFFELLGTAGSVALAYTTQGNDFVADEITAGASRALNVTRAQYGNAFELLEKHRWNVLSTDCDEEGVQCEMDEFLKSMYENGSFVMGVVGNTDMTNPPTTTSFNSHQMVCVGNGFWDRVGNPINGPFAAARVAGMIAGTPSNQSITRSVVNGAVEVMNPLSNFDHENAINAGIVNFSTSPSGAVWIESGVNTLTNVAANQDEGWKKIKRTKVRFELFQRLNDTVAPLVGNINNDPDGRMTIVQVGNSVCNAMISEGKLLAGAHVEEAQEQIGGDSAHFYVYADDIDALEKMYFTFKFRFAPEEQ